MTDTARIQTVIRRELRTLLQYAPQADLYSPPADRPFLVTLASIAAAERRQIDELEAWLLQQHRSLPVLGAFPLVFSHYHFVTVRSFVPHLIAAQRADCAQLATDVAAVTEPNLCERLDCFLQLKHGHLELLEKFAAPAPK
jgi:hypothetical protein